MLTLSDCDGGVGEDHETGDDLQLERVELLMPLLDSGTEGGVVHATVKVGSSVPLSRLSMRSMTRSSRSASPDRI